MWMALSLIDLVGAAAAASTLVAFAQKSMLPMRISAIAANVLFIIYGGLGPYYPVLILHVILLPLNIGRLVQCVRVDLTKMESGSLIDDWRRGR